MSTTVLPLSTRTLDSSRVRRGVMYPVLSRVPDVIFDQKFLNALRDRNTDAEDFLIAHFARPVQLKLRSRLRSPELVQDASQEAFLRVLNYFRSGKTLDNPASLPGFIHSVCHNISLELLRAHTRHDQMADDFRAPVDPRLNPEGRMVTIERREFVARVLAELPERDRLILRRIYLDEEDKDVVCREFNVGPSYLRVLVHRACIRFRNIVSGPHAAGTASGG
jgi:RNA polymerase sigma-70 factor (ECF subfamily)